MKTAHAGTARYAIVVGASASASARTTTVDRCEQARLAATSSDAPASSGGASAGEVADVGLAPVGRVRRDLSRRGASEARAHRKHHEQERLSALRKAQAEDAAQEAPIAEGVPVLMGGCHHVPPPDRVARCTFAERLVGTLVNVVGTNANDCGRACSRHSCCGTQVTERAMVAFSRKRLVFRKGREEESSLFISASMAYSRVRWAFCPLT